jgi:hypothetical protein
MVGLRARLVLLENTQKLVLNHVRPVVKVLIKITKLQTNVYYAPLANIPLVPEILLVVNVLPVQLHLTTVKEVVENVLLENSQMSHQLNV